MFRKLAGHYQNLTDQQLAGLMSHGDLTEICNAREAQVQE
jgi:hypothetical protein